MAYQHSCDIGGKNIIIKINYGDKYVCKHNNDPFN
jgi:hypothetical protein